MTTITLQVNGRDVTRDVEPQTLLVQFIRETLQLTGTHVGCDTSQCGACTVHVDGRAMKSCSMLAVQASGKKVTTIEGLAAADGTMHPMQAAFKECHGLQCGFCTPGMVMAAIDLVKCDIEGSEQMFIEAYGLELAGARISSALNVLRLLAKTARIEGRRLSAREALADARYLAGEVGPAEAAAYVEHGMTPDYPGKDRDDAWMREALG